MLSANSLRQSIRQNCCYRPLLSGGKRLIWEITSHCNLNCVHCFANKPSLSSDIPLDLALNICKDICSGDFSKVMITGGEPFLYRYIHTVIKKIRENPNILIDITTNGLLLSDSDISFLHDYNVNELSISFDGPREAMHSIRGIDCFDIVSTNVQKIHKIGRTIDGIMTINKLNYKFISETVKIAYNTGFSSLTISDLFYLIHSNFAYSRINLSPTEKLYVMNEIKELQSLYNNKFVIRTVGFSPLKNVDHFCDNKDLYAINYNGYALKCLNSAYSDDNLFDLRVFSLTDAVDQINRRHSNICTIK